MKIKKIPFSIRLVALEGRNPLSDEYLPQNEETLIVEAKNKIEAKDIAFALTSLKLRGQEVEVYINGELFRDPRW